MSTPPRQKFATKKHTLTLNANDKVASILLEDLPTVYHRQCHIHRNPIWPVLLVLVHHRSEVGPLFLLLYLDLGLVLLSPNSKDQLLVGIAEFRMLPEHEGDPQEITSPISPSTIPQELCIALLLGVPFTHTPRPRWCHSIQKIMPLPIQRPPIQHHR